VFPGQLDGGLHGVYIVGRSTRQSTASRTAVSLSLVVRSTAVHRARCNSYLSGKRKRRHGSRQRLKLVETDRKRSEPVWEFGS
jgi:hypothetical protein